MNYAIASVIVSHLIAAAVGFSIGINLRGNPPKRTRKTRKLTTPEQGQSESK